VQIEIVNEKKSIGVFEENDINILYDKNFTNLKLEDVFSESDDESPLYIEENIEKK